MPKPFALQWRAGGNDDEKSRSGIPVFVLLSCTVAAAVGSAQQKKLDKVRPSDINLGNSGPLTWITSDVNPKSVFWIQGRFVPVGDSKYQGDPEVVTILCSLRENECLEIDSENPFDRSEQVWIEDFKPASWDKAGILATTRSLDGCTDETLKIRFSTPSVVLINSPVLPMSENCKRVNNSWDTLLRKRGSGITAQMEEDMLIPTRGLFSFQDIDSETGRTPASVQQKNP